MASGVESLDRMPRLGPLFARAVLPRLDRGPARLPDRSVRVAGVATEIARLADYDRVCGFGLRDQVPATWLHVLSFPLHVHLLGDPGSSVRLAGTVHVANRMRLHRPVGITELLDVTVRAGNLRPHRRGALFDLAGEVRVDTELVWDGVSTYLAPGARASGETVETERMDADPATPIATWRLPAGLGRDYRRVSGDPNPIHTSALAARAFGFARPIIHGMWTHARLLAAMGSRVPPAHTAEVRFLKPILLPSTVGAWWRPEGTGWAASVTTPDGARPYLVARVEQAD
jgi:acyl dehydratase